jgi:capsular polysaccharide biosynthesis protein
MFQTQIKKQHLLKKVSKNLGNSKTPQCLKEEVTNKELI